MSKGKIIYVKGNVCEPQRLDENEFVVIPHCCNNLGVMGAGVALSLRKKWPQVFEEYEDMGKVSPNGLKNRLGEVCFVHLRDENNIAVANMIGQDGTVNPDNPKPVKYWALLKAMQETLMFAGIASDGKPVVFHCPKFGSDLAGGKWELIEELIKETWCERGCDVVVYEFEPNPDKWGPLTEIDKLNQKEDVLKSDLQKLEDRRRYFANLDSFSPEEQEDRKKNNNETLGYMEAYTENKDDCFPDTK